MRASSHERGLVAPLPTPTWERLPEAKRDAVRRAAEEEFGVRGYNAASLNTICREAGISKGSLFQYFTDKADLFVHLIARASHDIRAAMEAASADFPWMTDYIGSVNMLMDAWIDYFYDHPRHRQMLVSANLEHNPKALAAVREAVYVDYLEVIGGMIDLGIAIGALREDTDRDALVAAIIMLLPHIALGPHVRGLDPLLGLAGSDRTHAISVGRRMIQVLMGQYVSQSVPNEP